MAITTISIGTAGTQSGDKVRDAFSIVNQNFANFMVGDIKGYQTASFNVYTESDIFEYVSLLSNIPAGIYLVILSVNFQPGQEGRDHGEVFLFNLTGTEELGIRLRSAVEVEDTFTQSAIGLYSYYGGAWQMRLYYRNPDMSGGVGISGRVIMLRVS